MYYARLKYLRDFYHSYNLNSLTFIETVKSIFLSETLIFFHYVYKMKVKYLILFTLKELIPTSDSNVVVSLTRLFEVLLCNVVENDPTSKHIRIWIMVGFIFIVFFKL